MTRSRTLTWHIFVPFLAIIVLALALITAYSSRELRKMFYERTAEDLADRARLLHDPVAALLAAGDGAAIQAYCEQTGATSHMRLTIVAPDGTVLGDTLEKPERMENHRGREEIAAALGSGSGRSIRYSPSLGHRRMYVAVAVRRDGRTLGVLRTSHSLQSVDQATTLVLRQIAGGGLLLAALAGLVSFGVARRISTSLRQMQTGAERLAAGQLDTQLEIRSDAEELVSLAESFNTMAGQLSDRIRTIENQRNELTAVLGSMVEGVLAVDQEEVVFGWNEASGTLLGVDAKHAMGRSIQEVVRHPELIAMARAALAGDAPVEGDVVLARGQERHLQVHATGLRGGDGQRLGALLVLNDVTRLRRLENVRRDFVANVSHELRTPITSIKGFVETLRENPPQDPAETARFLAIVDRQAGRLQAIIDDLLILSRLEQETGLTRTDVDLQKLLVEAVDQCTARAGDESPPVAIECADGLTVSVNGHLVEQAVINLVDNALKHSAATQPIVVRAWPQDDTVVLEVEDQGRGIAAEHLPRVFERFYRVDRARSRTLGGTGLGLAIVKHIAQAHGGEVGVRSEVGAGTTFTVILPGSRSSSA
jgi:two-component system, OmpR family, phosphate regulon sensor histidine kinase PhoR